MSLLSLLINLMHPQTYCAAQLFICNHIIMISEDHVTLKTGVMMLKYSFEFRNTQVNTFTLENICFKILIIFHNFYCIFDQINAALMSRGDYTLHVQNQLLPSTQSPLKPPRFVCTTVFTCSDFNLKRLLLITRGLRKDPGTRDGAHRNPAMDQDGWTSRFI